MYVARIDRRRGRLYRMKMDSPVQRKIPALDDDTFQEFDRKSLHLMILKRDLRRCSMETGFVVGD